MAHRTCSIPDCVKRLHARSWCQMHYVRWKNHGDPYYVRPSVDRPMCIVAGCKRPSRARGWCPMHYQRWRTSGRPGEAASSQVDLSMTARERFERIGWDEVPNGCHRWRGKLDPRTGYGSLNIGGNVSENAHRVSYRLFVGPPDGFEVRHTCDNRWCINPAHLILGSRMENARDMVERGRSNVNERNPRAKLTDADVNAIRAARAAGAPALALAADYGVSRNYIYELAANRFRDTSRRYVRGPLVDSDGNALRA